MNNIKDSVWSYWNEGLSVIPLKEKSKSPNIPSWKEYENRLPEQKEIQGWLDKNLFKNIGIICGAVSNDLVVIDIDDEKIIDEIGLKINKILDRGQWLVRTGRGWHIYCKHLSNPGALTKDDTTHLEYRANGGYVVAPPSIHPNGHEYYFFNHELPSQLFSLQPIDAKAMFTNMVNSVKKKRGIKTTVAKQPIPMENVSAKCIQNILKGGFSEGKRNDTAFALANWYKYHKKLNPTEIKTLLINWNKRNKEPLPSYELNQVTNSALKSDKKTGCNRLRQLGVCPFEKRDQCNFYTPVKDEIKGLMRQYKCYTYKKIELPNGTQMTVPDRIICPNLSKLIDNEFEYHFLTIDDATREMYYYKNGKYNKNAENVIREKAQELMGDKSCIHSLNEIVENIRNSNYVSRDIFNNDPHLINVQNGIYNLKTDELIPHSHEYFFITKIPVKYDSNAGYSEFEKWLQHICMNQGERRPEIEKTIQEYWGYSLYRSYLFKSYLVLDGSGDNAKTTLFEILLRFIGSENNTSVPLQDLNDRPFTKCKLYGKHTNISDDLPRKGMKYSGVIKQITGNSPMWADIKNHKDGIEFTNIAKPWYGCNELPETKDYTDAFFSRQLQMTFLNKYVKPGDFDKVDEISVFKADVDIKNKLTTPESLSGILNWALIGLKRLLKNKSFSLSQTTEEKRETWLKKTNPVHALIEEEYETGGDDWCVTVDDFAEDVINYCRKMGFDKPTRHYITTRLNNEGINIRKRQLTVNNIPRTWVWVGLRSTVDNTINHFIGRNDEKPKMEGFF